MKLGWNLKATYRRRYVFALLLISVGVIALPTIALRSISAAQSATGEQHSEYPELPAGDGKDSVLRLCVKCHSPNIILAWGQNRTGWENTITKMVRLGATGTDEDFTDIADYLTANFPPSAVKKIFVNMATDKEIAETLEIGIEDARAIVAYRDKIKGFKSPEEMKQVPGVDAKKIDARKDRLVFGSAAAHPST